MYQEIYTAGKSSFLYIIITVVIGFCLMSVPQWFGLTDFIWVYELAVLAVMAFLVYTILRNSSYKYTYLINGDVLTVKLRLGSKETVLCAMSFVDVVHVEENMKIKELREKYGVKTVLRCNGELQSTAGTDIVFNNKDTGDTSVLIFRPSEKFTQILQTKMLDKNVSI